MYIGILECGRMPDGLRERVGDYPPMFTRLLGGRGFTFATWHVEGTVFPDSVHAADGWLITGSRHGAYEDHAFIPPLEQFIRDAFATGRPVVGVCFGHQIMAQALGGQVTKHPGGWIVGPQDYSFDDGVHRLNAWHQDQVVTPPPGARTVAQGPDCAHAALSYGAAGYSVQGHPEFDDAVIAGLITQRGPGVVPADRLAAAQAGLGRADPRTVADRIAGTLARTS